MFIYLYIYSSIYVFYLCCSDPTYDAPDDVAKTAQKDVSKAAKKQHKTKAAKKQHVPKAEDSTYVSPGTQKEQAAEAAENQALYSVRYAPYKMMWIYQW